MGRYAKFLWESPEDITPFNPNSFRSDVKNFRRPANDNSYAQKEREYREFAKTNKNFREIHRFNAHQEMHEAIVKSLQAKMRKLQKRHNINVLFGRFKKLHLDLNDAMHAHNMAATSLQLRKQTYQAKAHRDLTGRAHPSRIVASFEHADPDEYEKEAKEWAKRAKELTDRHLPEYEKAMKEAPTKFGVFKNGKRIPDEEYEGAEAEREARRNMSMAERYKFYKDKKDKIKEDVTFFDDPIKESLVRESVESFCRRLYEEDDDNIIPFRPPVKKLTLAKNTNNVIDLGNKEFKKRRKMRRTARELLDIHNERLNDPEISKKLKFHHTIAKQKWNNFLNSGKKEDFDDAFGHSLGYAPPEKKWQPTKQQKLPHPELDSVRSAIRKKSKKTQKKNVPEIPFDKGWRRHKKLMDLLHKKSRDAIEKKWRDRLDNNDDDDK